jgi:hypothetical protein
MKSEDDERFSELAEDVLEKISLYDAMLFFSRNFEFTE